MKLLAHEQRDLDKALKQAGFDEHFYFRKKKGWVYIKDPISRAIFSFHRRKTLSLIDGSFKEEIKYLAQVGADNHEFDSWGELFLLFRNWLTTLS